MKKLLSITVLIVLVGALVAVACAAPSTAPAPAPSKTSTPSPTAAPAPEVKPVTLKFTTIVTTPPPPPAELVGDQDAIVWWAAQIEEKTQGRVKINMQWSGILGKPADFVKMIGTGVAEAGHIVGVYHTSELPLRNVASLPFLTSGFETAAPALDKLYVEWAPMRDELKKFNLMLMVNQQPLNNWLCLNAKQAPTKMSDLAGMKIGPPGASYGKLLEAYNITSVSVSAPETYEALQKGVIAGKVSTLQNPKQYAQYEVAKYMVDFEFTGGQTINGYVINLDTWNKISPADQKAIQSVNDAIFKHYVAYLKDERQKLLDFYKSKGMVLVSFSPEEQAAVKAKVAQTIWDEWVKESTVRGIPATEALKRYQDAVAAITKK